MSMSLRYCVSAFAVLALAAASVAQVPKPPDISRMRAIVIDLRNGKFRVDDPENPSKTAENRAALKAVAEYFAYSVAVAPYNGELPPRDDKSAGPNDTRSFATLLEEAERFAQLAVGATTDGKLSVAQQEYGREYGLAMAAAVKTVLASSARPVERINAVRMLAMTARLPSPGMADLLIEIARNEQNPEPVKLFAFQGLKNLLDQSEQNDASKHIIKDVQKLKDVNDVLSAYVFQKRTLSSDATIAEKERAVIEYVRREAVAALARFKESVLRKPNVAKELIVRPSWPLMRVIEQDPNVFPKFTIQEQIEAAIGFCHMKIDPDMNLDVAAYSIGKFLVNFARAANVDNERSTRDGTLPVLPWKISAARVSYALAIWRESVKSLPPNRMPGNVATVAGLGIALTAPIEKTGVSANTATEVQAIFNWGRDNTPVAWKQQQPATLYTDDPKSILPFPEPPPPGKTSTLTTPGPDPRKVEPGKSGEPKKGN